MREVRESEATEDVFAFRQKSLFISGCVQGAIIKIVCLSVRLSVSDSVCVTLVVFTDCQSCTRPISTNPRSMEAGEYGLTRGTCFLACRLELDAVAGLLWISWYVFGGGDFFPCFFFFLFSSNSHGLLQP